MLRILRFEDHPGLSGWAQFNQKDPSKRKQEDQSQRETLKDATTLLALKMDHGPQEDLEAACRSSKIQGHGFFP